MAQLNNKDHQVSDLEKADHIKNIARSVAKLNLQFKVPMKEFFDIYQTELLKEAGT
ncbi:MAG: hypothetical protein L3J52_01150 [Proteobacteria bacterium]|nr:hypothetical protein [Pseudomonadota bacterium]